MSQEERIAYNESWCRHLSERKASWIRKRPASRRVSMRMLACGLH